MIQILWKSNPHDLIHLGCTVSFHSMRVTFDEKHFIFWFKVTLFMGHPVYQCVYISVCMSVCVCQCVYVSVYMFVCVCLCVYACVCMPLLVCLCLSVFVYVCLIVSVCVWWLFDNGVPGRVFETKKRIRRIITQSLQKLGLSSKVRCCISFTIQYYCIEYIVHGSIIKSSWYFCTW